MFYLLKLSTSLHDPALEGTRLNVARAFVRLFMQLVSEAKTFLVWSTWFRLSQ